MIDIVLLWVDGNDPVWLAEYEKYAPKVNGDKRNVRFRDWDSCFEELRNMLLGSARCIS